jgi:hypothetical protein
VAGEAVITVIGIDPGHTAGLVLAGWERSAKKVSHVHAYQCDGGSLLGLARMIVSDFPVRITAAAIEAFDDRPGRRKLANANPRQIRAQVTALTLLLQEHGIPAYVRQVSDVKSWIEVEKDNGEARLAAAGIWDLVSPAAMIHARSASWHAVFCAVKQCGIPDPLSRKAVPSR